MDAELLADAEEATQKLKINKLIGYGAFARVYSCEFQNAHETQQVALKVLRSKFCADAADPTRSCFVREAQALHAIRNVSIVRCLGMVKLPTGMPGLTEEDGSLGMILQLGTVSQQTMHRSCKLHAHMCNITQSACPCRQARCIVNVHSPANAGGYLI